MGKNKYVVFSPDQTKDDAAGKGFIKGGAIGIIFAVLFGGAAWVVAGAALGAAFAIFDRGIKDKLLKELVADHLAAVEALTENKEVIEAVPAEVEL